MVRSALSNSLSDIVSMNQDGDAAMSNGQLTILTQTHREWVNTNAPLDERWARAISVMPFCSRADANGSNAAASEAVLQMQTRVVASDLWMGLKDVKDWVSFSVHRILVPPEDPRERMISQSIPSNPFCVTISSESCGVRRYLEAVCQELRIDYFRVGATYYEDGMMEDLVEAARTRRRALILFDRTNWFSHAEYATRGASFMHHLRAAMSSTRARQAMDETSESGAATSIYNSMNLDTMATLLPRLWVVISANNTDVVQEVMQFAGGCVYRMSNASESMAFSVVRIQLAKKGEMYGFAAQDVEHMMSQTRYVNDLRDISRILQQTEVGAIIGIIEVACTIAYRRSRQSPTYTAATLDGLFPLAVDVQQAMNQLTGQSVGSLASAVAATQQPTSTAAEVARAINAGAASGGGFY